MSSSSLTALCRESPATGLIGYNPVGLAQALADGLVDRLAARGGSEGGVDTAPTTERNTKNALQAARDLAVRQTAMFVEFNDGGLASGPSCTAAAPRASHVCQG
jgi:hypothetical protein